MNTIYIQTPEITAQDVANFTEEQEYELVSQLNQMRSKTYELVEAMVEKRVMAVYQELRPTAHSVSIDPNYEYNDEGYVPDNVMVFIDGEDPCYEDNSNSSFQSAIDEALVDIADIMTESMEINIDSLLGKYNVKPVSKKKVGKITRYEL